MSISFKTSGRSGDYVKASVLPANRSHMAHFGLIDGVIITFFLSVVAGLIFLLAR
jgi:hypothetical protein